MSAIVFLLLAVAITVVGSIVVYIRQRSPSSLESGIDDFRREMQALATRQGTPAAPAAVPTTPTPGLAGNGHGVSNGGGKGGGNGNGSAQVNGSGEAKGHGEANGHGDDSSADTADDRATDATEAAAKAAGSGSPEAEA